MNDMDIELNLKRKNIDTEVLESDSSKKKNDNGNLNEKTNQLISTDKSNQLVKGDESSQLATTGDSNLEPFDIDKNMNLLDKRDQIFLKIFQLNFNQIQNTNKQILDKISLKSDKISSTNLINNQINNQLNVNLISKNIKNKKINEEKESYKLSISIKDTNVSKIRTYVRDTGLLDYDPINNLPSIQILNTNTDEINKVHHIFFLNEEDRERAKSKLIDKFTILDDDNINVYTNEKYIIHGFRSMNKSQLKSKIVNSERGRRDVINDNSIDITKMYTRGSTAAVIIYKTQQAIDEINSNSTHSFDFKTYNLVKYKAIRSCAKCCSYEHLEEACNSIDYKCSKCTKNHSPANCLATPEEYRCIFCINSNNSRANHPSTSLACPVRINRISNLE